MIFPLKTPSFINSLFPDLIWNIKTSKKEIFLTFDDGPIEEVTPFVLEELKKAKAKATFFCIGDNIRKHPHVYNELIEDGHLAANHTYNHLSGWKMSNEKYFGNIDKCEKLLNQENKIFRPPYGRIKGSQIKYLKDSYKIIMWDVLSGDFDKNLNPQKCLNSCIQKTNAGSIIVFHDSIKAFPILKYVLPRYIEHFSNLGFKFEVIRL